MDRSKTQTLLHQVMAALEAAEPLQQEVRTVQWWRERDVLFKDGVPHDTLREQAANGLVTAAALYRELQQGRLLMCTSTTESKHSVHRSAHYRGDAFDLRILHGAFDDAQHIAVFVTDLKRELGPDFVVVLEATHIHVHWSPIYHADRDPAAAEAA